MRRSKFVLLLFLFTNCCRVGGDSPPPTPARDLSPADMSMKPDLKEQPIRGICQLVPALKPSINVAAGTPDVLAMEGTLSLPATGPAYGYNPGTMKRDLYLGEFPCERVLVTQFIARMLGTAVPDLGGYLNFIDAADNVSRAACYGLSTRLKSGETISFQILEKCTWSAGADQCTDKPLKCDSGPIIVAPGSPQQIGLRVNGATTKAGESLQIGVIVIATGESSGASLSFSGPTTDPLEFN